MKVFKPILIKGLEGYEINEDGYVLYPDGELAAFSLNENIMGIKVVAIINELFWHES